LARRLNQRQKLLRGVRLALLDGRKMRVTSLMEAPDAR
jgi:hypothetical protein